MSSAAGPTMAMAIRQLFFFASATAAAATALACSLVIGGPYSSWGCGAWDWAWSAPTSRNAPPRTRTVAIRVRMDRVSRSIKAPNDLSSDLPRDLPNDLFGVTRPGRHDVVENPSSLRPGVGIVVLGTRLRSWRRPLGRPPPSETGKRIGELPFPEQAGRVSWPWTC